VIARRRLLAGAALAPVVGAVLAQTETSALEKVKQRGSLTVAVYQDMPPFHDGGQGIDVDLAAALAAGLGVKSSLLAMRADEELEDDLRHAVWRGHYLGWGPADVMLHVPVDRPLIDKVPQVSIFGPYYQERVLLAWDRERGPVPESLMALQGKPIAVSGLSLAGWLMIGAEGGALRPTLTTRHAHGVAAAEALLRGEAVAAAGLASELESALAGKPRYAIMPIPSPRAPRNGWAVGMAVKKGATDLAEALQKRLNELAASGELRAMFDKRGVAWRPLQG
jgi:ABC-type amino acid transport substrate-binding protein